MLDTPRTNKVLKACRGLGIGSIVEVPPNYPPHDPWELARDLERKLNQCCTLLEEIQKDLSVVSVEDDLWLNEISRDIEKTLWKTKNL